MRIQRFLAVNLMLLAFLITSPAARAAEIESAPGIHAEEFIHLQGLQGFNWDEHGGIWVLTAKANRLILSTVTRTPVVETIGSFERRGNEGPRLLIHGGRAFVSDGDAIRVFVAKDGKFLDEQPPQVLSANLFPIDSQITSLHWSPLGPVSFGYRSPRETGIGRLDLRHGRWDVVAKGLAGDLAYDLDGFPIVSDDASGQLFRLALGLDYERGLHNYTKRDLAIPTDKTGLKPAAIGMHPGGNWPDENRGTWLVVDRASSSLQQHKEQNNQLKFWRNLVRWTHTISTADLQIGPDGGIWMLLASADKNAASIYRILPADSSALANAAVEITSLPNKDLVAVLKHENSWQREAALRILDDRIDLRQTRGLHPGTPLHDLYNDTNATVIARTHALLSLHRLELLDETMLENVTDEPAPALRIWAGLLFGERNYPTGTAFNMIMKLAKDPNIDIRMAAAIASRQFVSGSLAIDTAPRAMPIREVFTGGILSTLWFSTEKSSSPAFDLLFWNAVRPISAYDPAHPIGFFNGDREEGLPIAYWIIGLLAQQIAEQDHPLKQEDAMLMVGELKPINRRMILAALKGLKKGTPQRRVLPTEKSLKVLADLSRNENCAIASLAQEIFNAWKSPTLSQGNQ